ncbi:Upc2 protein [Apiospora arundinis]
MSRRCSFLDLCSARLPARLPSPAVTEALSSATPSSSCCSASPAFSSQEALTPTTDVQRDVGAPHGHECTAQPPQAGFDMRHLVLLHHLDTHVVGSSSFLSWTGVNAANLYSEAVFKPAVSAPYLMHELLAFSALHLSTQQVDDAARADYLQQATALQTRALALFNAVEHDVREENCMALFAFSSLLGMHTLFDAVASCKDLGDILDKTIHYLKVHRGVYAITSRSWQILRQSEIRCIVDAIETGAKLYEQQPDDTDNECNRLSSLLRAHSDKLGPGPYRACQEAVEALHWTFGVRRTVHAPYSTHVTLAWPVRVTADFAELLQQRQPIALVILAHWAVLLHVDREFWIFGDAGQRLIRALLTYLGSYWDKWLDLPRSVFHE